MSRSLQNKQLWLEMPCCECCSGPYGNCIANKPCTHCQHFLDVVHQYITKERSEIADKLHELAEKPIGIIRKDIHEFAKQLKDRQ